MCVCVCVCVCDLPFLQEKTETKQVQVELDDGIVFDQLTGQSDFVGENKFEMGLLQATGAVGGPKKDQLTASKLNKVCVCVCVHEGVASYCRTYIHTHTHAHMQVIQLTGFSDPVYAEAYVNVNQYDIVLDMLVVNQTADTLQGLSLELATIGECSSRYPCDCVNIIVCDG